MLKFLITDDDPAGRRLLGRFLSPYGRCDLAFSGEEALDFFRLAIREGERYDLVCLDLMMPGADGHEVLQSLRQIEAENDILGSDGVKVLIVTAMNDPQHCIRAFREGCESYLVKPIQRDAVLSRIRDLGLLPAAATR